jgi:8-oxo-dGTP diphosphatase
MKPFSGTKIALVNQGRVLTILRDDKPDIDFPGMWDFPGGGREGNETPIATAIREIKEELNIDLIPDEVVWQKLYSAVADPAKKAYFLVFNVTNEQIGSIVFGSEGKQWKMVDFNDFLTNKNAVEGMQTRLRDYLVFAHLLR